MRIRLLAAALLAALILPLRAAAAEEILFFGDSLTAGYGLDDADRDAYPALIQRKIAAAGLPWTVVNAGLSGDTTAGGLRRLDWALRRLPDVFLLELGANDGLRGLPTQVTASNLEAIIARVRARDPAALIVLIGMRMPPSLGQDFTGAFAAIYPRVAAQAHVPLVPFLLAGVGGVPGMNQPDEIHPTAAGHAVLAENVWKVLGPLLEARARAENPSTAAKASG
jgi:acyl-CoA thioesterase-1